MIFETEVILCLYYHHLPPERILQGPFHLSPSGAKYGQYVAAEIYHHHRRKRICARICAFIYTTSVLQWQCQRFRDLFLKHIQCAYAEWEKKGSKLSILTPFPWTTSYQPLSMQLTKSKEVGGKGYIIPKMDQLGFPTSAYANVDQFI